MANTFLCRYDTTTGALSSLVNANDPDEMNWVEGDHGWGVIVGSEIVSCEECGDGIKVIYETPHLFTTVYRHVVDGVYREKYVFKNKLSTDVFLNRGDLGIYATFNDNYEIADISMRKRCNTHIWCGGNSSYVKAVKMGPCEYGLGLVLTTGSLDSYSVQRRFEMMSDDRGDFILHPSELRLLPGEEAVIEWELFWFASGEFEKCLSQYQSVILVEAEHYTVFGNEKIRFSVNRPDAKIYYDSERLTTETLNGKTRVLYTPKERGEYRFDIECNGVKTYCCFYAQISIWELIKRRVNFIVNKQQYHREGSALDGAYLIYDNEDKCLVFDDLNGDLNASRERLVMAILIAKYLQFERDEKIYASLMKYYEFVRREFFDEETGMVYNTIGKNPAFKRLYNGPWMAMFMMELYKLTKDEAYLQRMCCILRFYYSVGGGRFYPNGLSMYEMVEVLQSAGKDELAAEIQGLFVQHAENIVNIDLKYPTHEVRYEQTIVTPAVNSLAQIYLLTKRPEMLKACERHLDVLERFNGQQPSYKLHEMSIRHWDGYWFGKRKLYGDTFPHSATIHTSVAYFNYYLASANEEYRRRAIESARNIVCLYREDGSAYTCYLYPFSVNGQKGEYYDPYANEQDGYLYYLLKFFGAYQKEAIV